MVRLNALPALPVVQTPSVCRRVVCQIGGYPEVRDAVEQAGVDVRVARTYAGVLAFGADADVRAAFEALTQKGPPRTSPESAPSSAITDSSTT